MRIIPHRLLIQGADVGPIRLFLQRGGGAIGFQLVAVMNGAHRADAGFSRLLGFMGGLHADIFALHLADLPVGLQRRGRKNRMGELGGRPGLVDFLKIQARFWLGLRLVKNALFLENLFLGDLRLRLFQPIRRLIRFADMGRKLRVGAFLVGKAQAVGIAFLPFGAHAITPLLRRAWSS